MSLVSTKKIFRNWRGFLIGLKKRKEKRKKQEKETDGNFDDEWRTRFRAFVKGAAASSSQQQQQIKDGGARARRSEHWLFFISTLALTASGDFGAQTNVFWNVSRCGRQPAHRSRPLRRRIKKPYSNSGTRASPRE